MTPDMIALARALVALPGWEWRPGMVALPESHPDERWLLAWADPAAGWHGGGVQTHHPHKEWAVGHDEHDPIELGQGWVPDLLDPATGGVMLDMLARRGGAWSAGRYEETWDWWVSLRDGAEAHVLVEPSLAAACARAMVARGRA